MARLFRPHIPLEPRCRVVLRQLGELWIDDVIAAHRTSLNRLLAIKLRTLSELMNCTINDLRLDHDPPLGARERRGEGKNTVYSPDANDPDHLFYREKSAHDVKTRIRGEHGQFSDLALIKRERRRQRKRSKPKKKWASRPWPKSRKMRGKQ